MGYAGNFAGSVALAALVTAGGTLVRGILCNWLVCMAVWMASMAKDLPGKIVAIWFPISAFVAMGLEHSVANMFIIPLGIMSGAAITWKTFLLKNLLPVTLGNIVGGAVCVATGFWAAYGSKD